MNHNIPLGKKTQYPDLYDKSLLYPIAREQYRSDIPPSDLKIYGFDLWNTYEFSFLEKSSGWPIQGHLRIIIPSTSKSIIESKSLKLYLGSYANSLFTLDEALAYIKQDIESLILGTIDIQFSPSFFKEELLSYPKDYQNILNIKNLEGHFKVFFQGFKSMCPVTSSPDFATILIDAKTNHQQNSNNLQEYLHSFSKKQEFHEHCIELLFSSLVSEFEFTQLTVIGLFARRGSLDINPVRSLNPISPSIFKRDMLN